MLRVNTPVCGIAGIYAYHYAANPVDREELTRIRDRMVSRGPDGAGLWCSEDGRIGLAHRRLSIIDLSVTGAQPMVSAGELSIVTFNGEIYNYRELRRELEADGHLFNSQSDTEVLLKLYEVMGPAMFDKLRGMFAFAIWDERKGELFLARDPYGIKPLYYADDGWTFRFASQVKALLAGNLSREPEPAGWVGYYLFGSVPEPYTTYHAIRALPAGTSMVVDRRGPRPPKRFFSIAQTYCDAERHRSEANHIDASAEAAEALADSVRAHLVADVPVGAFLSAGVDSSALVGLMRDAGQSELDTVTLSFAEFSGRHDDEAPLAREVARRYGTRHTTRTVTEREFLDDLPRILDAMDQPTIDGINTWFVSKAAGELGLKVAISGLGGDELFGGYPSFRTIPRWVRTFGLPGRVPGLGRALRHAVAALRPNLLGVSPKVAGLFEFGASYPGAYLLMRGLFMPWELPLVLDRDLVREGLRRLQPMRSIAAALEPAPDTPFARVAALESGLYMRNQLLRDTDWASMSHSIEVRVPLVDVRLLAALAPITVDGIAVVGKSLLAASPRTPLPTAVTSRAKTGFGTPVADWLQRSRTQRLRPYTDISALAAPACPWARRWAYSLAAAA